MEDTVIRPTLKYIKLGYALVLLLIVGAAIGAGMLPTEDAPYRPWIIGVAVLFLIWPARRQAARQVTKATVAGDKLRYEVGLLSKTTRNISLPKVQDVRVDQTVTQRIFNVGSLSVETAGEASRLVIHNIDRPNEVASLILAASHDSPTGRGQIA
jgi:uncharacterized membrane protein YdbT with pleckstrin-like domain